MLVLSACWSGHELIDSPCHHQPLPVKMILRSIFEGTLFDKKTGLKARLQVYTLVVCMCRGSLPGMNQRNVQSGLQIRQDMVFLEISSTSF